jgi:phosphoenolpyruvate carboxykinase (ATP)
MYHYLSGYTAKVAGTEVGVREPEATFSACFGAAFLVWHPTKYAQLLADRIRRHGSRAWLVNTGWSGGPYGVGRRLSIRHTRAIIDAIHSGKLDALPGRKDPLFGLDVPCRCAGVPDEVLVPRNTWSDRGAYDRTASKLAALFRKNFERYAAAAGPELCQAGPRAPEDVAKGASES